MEITLEMTKDEAEILEIILSAEEVGTAKELRARLLAAIKSNADIRLKIESMGLKAGG